LHITAAPGCAASGVVVSYAYWQSQLAGDSRAIGSKLIIGRHAVPIVGVTARGFTGPEVGRSFDVAPPICSQTAYWTDGVAQFVMSMLFGIKPSDPLTLVLAPVVLCGVSVAAAFIRARRAAAVDPMTALRYERDALGLGLALVP
jgi:hypothetical protein